MNLYNINHVIWVSPYIKTNNLPVDVLGRGYVPFENKWEGLLPYHYSIVIENAQEPYYFTEKIIDAMMCNTIPIYWGTPNIGDYFDVTGMVICNNVPELISVYIVCLINRRKSY